MIDSETTPLDIFVNVVVATPEQLTKYSKLIDSKSSSNYQQPISGYFLILVQWIDFAFKTLLYRLKIKGTCKPIDPGTFNMIVELSGKIELARKIITKFHTEEAWNKLINALLSKWEELSPQELARSSVERTNASVDEKQEEQYYSNLKTKYPIQQIKELLNKPFP